MSDALEPARKRLATLDAAIARGATDPFLFYARALELRALGEPHDALAELEAVAVRFPGYVPTYLIAGQLAVELGRLDRARVLLEMGALRARDAHDGKAQSEIEAALASLPPEPA